MHAHTVTAPPTAYRDVIFVNIIKCGHSTRAALISLNKLYVRLLFEGGYYSTCGYYSSKYGIQYFYQSSEHDTLIMKTNNHVHRTLMKFELSKIYIEKRTTTKKHIEYKYEPNIHVTMS